MITFVTFQWGSSLTKVVQLFVRAKKLGEPASKHLFYGFTIGKLGIGVVRQVRWEE